MPSVFDIKNRPTIRGRVNPLDKASIISIYPKQIIENKWTINPGRFIVEAGTIAKPSVLIVEPSSWWKDVDLDQPLLEISIGSLLIAESVIGDYCRGLYGCNMTDTMPGLFYVEGSVTVEKVLSDHQPQLKSAQAKQDRWFKFMVEQADALWAKTNGNPLAIMDDMRIAAVQLGLDKEWAKSHIIRELVRCLFCGTLRDPQYPKCSHCLEIVDKQLAIKLGLIPDPKLMNPPVK